MAIVRKDKLLAGYNGNLESVIIHDTKEVEGVSKQVPVESTNGVFVALDGLMEGQREVKKAHLADATEIAKDVLLIHNPEVMYDERKYKLEDYVIAEGKVARAYRLYDGDIITLTTDLFAETVAVGDVLAVKADGKLGKLADGAEAKVTFEVIEDSGYELHPTMGAFAVQVVRN